ncbi:MAG: hypothetical protein ACFB0B_03165 [Thermonemataceae bacterium]
MRKKIILLLLFVTLTVALKAQEIDSSDQEKIQLILDDYFVDEGWQKFIEEGTPQTIKNRLTFISEKEFKPLKDSIYKAKEGQLFLPLFYENFSKVELDELYQLTLERRKKETSSFVEEESFPQKAEEDDFYETALGKKVARIFPDILKVYHQKLTWYEDEFCYLDSINYVRKKAQIEEIDQDKKVAVDRADGFYLINEEPEAIPANYEAHLGSLKIPEAPVISFTEVTSATVALSTWGFSYVVNVKFSETAKQKLYEITQANIGKVIAIVANKQIVMAPRIHSPIAGGEVQISGKNINVAEANTMIERFNKK